MTTKDTSAIQKIVNVTADLIGETINNLKDGKISKLEMIGYTDNLIPLVEALMGSPEAVAEVRAGIDAAGRAEICAGLKAHFDIEDDELETVIEDIAHGALQMVEGAIIVGKGVKAIRDSKKKS